jgi:L-alanine-DL-glutamate epimerase-like enolase superfamily enzyme
VNVQETASVFAKSAGFRQAAIEDVRAFSYTIPTDRPEADGTLACDSTTLVLAEVRGGGKVGLGYTYSNSSITSLISGELADIVKRYDAFDPPAAGRAMNVAVRNMGRDGLAANGISALDTAIWDLKAKLLDVSLASLFGRFREAIPIYGSGGFTSYSDDELREQLSGWVERDGCRC